MLEKLQAELLVWQKHNFPDRTWIEPFMGLVEEIGELSHSLLKQRQKIRGTFEEHERAAQDSVGDILVFLADLCNAHGWNLQEIINHVWSEVKQRDWVKYRKEHGLT